MTVTLERHSALAHAPGRRDSGSGRTIRPQDLEIGIDGGSALGDSEHAGRLASSCESRDLFPQSSFQVRGRCRFKVGEVGCNGSEGVPLTQALCRDIT